MTGEQGMPGHFSRIAGLYRDLRTTDEAPVRYIRDALRGRSQVEAADVGCGDGRYDVLLFRYLPNLRLTCVDASAEMLAHLRRHLSAHGIARFETVQARAEDQALRAGTLDCVFTFNAIHHFDVGAFLAMAGRAIRAGGRIFIYTRTPEQNAESVWGRYFPGFLERETRLLTEADMEAHIARAGLRLIDNRRFTYARVSTVERLLALVQCRHYSTFCFYTQEELGRACAVFADTLRRRFADPGRIAWRDGNIMFQIGRPRGV